VIASGFAIRFVCVGAQKAGTTSLHDALATHPAVVLPEQKETKFFSEDDAYARGVEYYHRTYFANAPAGATAGEIDPEYLYLPGAPARLYEYAADLKLIVMLRDPVDRAYSHYLMSVRRGFERHSFEEAIELEPDRLERSPFHRVHFSYVDRGFYARQVRRYLDLFPWEQFHFMFLEDFVGSFPREMNRLCEFLGVERHEWPGRPPSSNPAVTPRVMWLSRLLHSHGRLKRAAKRVFKDDGPVATLARRVREDNLVPFEPESLAAETRARLAARYREATKELEELIGRDLGHWVGAG
jgi:hypothetical protein